MISQNNGTILTSIFFNNVDEKGCAWMPTSANQKYFADALLIAYYDKEVQRSLCSFINKQKGRM